MVVRRSPVLRQPDNGRIAFGPSVCRCRFCRANRQMESWHDAAQRLREQRPRSFRAACLSEVDREHSHEADAGLDTARIRTLLGLSRILAAASLLAATGCGGAPEGSSGDLQDSSGTENLVNAETRRSDEGTDERARHKLCFGACAMAGSSPCPLSDSSRTAPPSTAPVYHRPSRSRC